ncbi:TPA: hypothetical protein ACPGEY_001304 [Haemophilus influenzae]|uniref:hypothetical protein n=1 Tax=Haemophilus influenzae TaxID=727 RepID=UPI000681D035|nr:hypothetical protein [Haemophilus influenzae]KMZ22335.1 hypothetical protein ABN54_04745 [Haemophilus influenzae]MCK8884289.1 hypothetical protein [Haemophilus influenzae]MCK9048212.1 hypothetical protein [Haemophilus influenzae]PRI46696.1 hypothetical protein BVZ71_00342 [Haemophilus influenzae]PRM37772.1 hypothetical protein BVZ73_00779 [Haemophilus influenzae]
MNFEQIIEQRIKALKEAHISNQIEGADMGVAHFLLCLKELAHRLPMKNLNDKNYYWLNNYSPNKKDYLSVKSNL